MKHVIILIVFFLSKVIIASTEFGGVYLTDTIAPPPEFPSTITGTTSSCVGDTTVYTADIPISCIANWYIDSVLQSTATGILEVIWTESGSFLINLDIVCDTNIYSAGSLLVNVTNIPDNPNPVMGETEVCNLSTEIYTTEVNSGESCQWIVDSIVQVSTTATLSYYWVELGMHTIEVRAINDCGISEAEILDINVNDMPVVYLGNDTVLYQGQSIVLDAANPGCSYLWSTGDTTQIIIVSQSGNYNVVVTNGCGDATDNINVEVVVDIDKLIKSNRINIVTRGDYIFVNIKNALIEKVQIWDITGRLVIDSVNKPYYYLPQKGVFIVRASTKSGNKYSYRIIK